MLFQLGDSFVRLDHVSYIGPAQNEPNRPNAMSFEIIVGGVSHKCMFNPQRTHELRQNLIEAINGLRAPD
jgi:hypothetical protein